VKKVKMEDYKNAFMNLGLPMFQFAEPSPAETTKITDSVSVTIWDQWDLKMGDITLTDFCNHFKVGFLFVLVLRQWLGRRTCVVC
jgi:hypothetical protein